MPSLVGSEMCIRDRYMTDRKAEIIKKISNSGKLDDALEAELKGALDDYKAANK